MQRLIYSISLVVTCLIAASNAARILGLFPMLAKSHFGCNHAMLKSLHAAGHQITMVTSLPPAKKMENFTYVVPPKTVFSFVGQSTIDVDGWLDQRESFGDTMKWATEIFIGYCESMMDLPLIQDALRSSEKRYDAIMAEYLFDFECYLPIAEKLGVPIIATLTLHSLKWVDQDIGLPYNPAVIPLDLYSPNGEMNLFARAKNLWSYLRLEYYYSFTRSEIDKFYHKHFPQELHYKKDISLIFYNNHPSVLPRPIVPKAIEVGGIHVTPAQPLPKDIQKFIDEAPHGVIFFSLGSVVRGSSMSAEKMQAFLTAFASIPQRVIWKFEEPVKNLPENIMISSWLPQRDILEHKNVIAFMSHCGQSGVYEAVMTGTPIVTIPLFADQGPNAAFLLYRDVAVNLDYRTATKETVLEALNAIVNDTRYYRGMQELSRVYNDRPMTPQESVVYWTEYVIRHNGAPHLRAIGTDMPLYQYLMLDIIALGLTFAIFFIVLIYIIVKKIYTFFIANNESSRLTVYMQKDE